MDFYSMKEGIDVEFKSAQGGFPKSFYETYSAFSNTKGGHIYLGVEEKNDVVVAVPGLTLATIELFKQNMIDTLNNKSKVSENNITNSDINIIKLGEKDKYVLDIFVKEQNRGRKPIYLDGKISNSYKRDGKNDFLLSNEELLYFLNDRYFYTKDSEVNDRGYTFKDIEKTTISAFRNMFNAQNKNNLYEAYDDETFCKELGFIARNKDGEMLLTNAAVLFFTKAIKIQTIYPNYFVDYQERITNDTRWDYRLCSIDFDWSGNLFDFFRIALDKACVNLPNKYEKQGISDQSGFDIKDAIKEALVNAFSNADYINGGTIKIIKTANGIECTNSGEPLVSVEQMMVGGITNPRNKEIIRYFRLLRYSERSGYGVKNIFNIFDKNKLVAPKIEEKKDTREMSIKMLFTQGYVEEITTKVSSQDILGYLLGKEDGVSQEEMVKHFNVSLPTIAKVMDVLIATGAVMTNGKKTKGKRYILRIK